MYDNQVVLGDCIAVMRNMPSDSVDLVLTDPPYNIDKKYEGYNDKMAASHFWDFIGMTYKEIARVLKPRCHLAFTCAQKQIWVYRPLLEQLGLAFRHLAIWHNPARKAGSYPGQWPHAWEAIMDWTKGDKFRKLNNGNSVGHMDIWIEKPPPKIKHPARRPLSCWRDLVMLLSDEGDVVLDPFMGSGTTGVVCKQSGRRFVGIEISSTYVELAQKRLEAVHA